MRDGILNAGNVVTSPGQKREPWKLLLSNPRNEADEMVNIAADLLVSDEDTTASTRGTKFKKSTLG